MGNFPPIMDSLYAALINRQPPKLFVVVRVELLQQLNNSQKKKLHGTLQQQYGSQSKNKIKAHTAKKALKQSRK